MTREPQTVVGVLLAGGRSSRMGGGDKCLRLLGGRPILARVIARAKPQVGPLVLNANGDPARFSAFGLPVARDPVEGFAGPLAGVLAGLLWVRAHHPDVAWVASFPTDVPFFPDDVVERLIAARNVQQADLAYAESGGRTHPVFGLWPVGLADALHRDLAQGGARKVEAWMAGHRVATAAYPTKPFDPFLNINRPEDEAVVERLIAEGVVPA
ncbi:MAG: molybdenum cofactor guanylyltransferase MobA [Alphaproteobacteria bacterium]|nr:molybdenum cofactor guanylyltransferase MobA [Alphaproteobacteria bacterium]